jgi:cyclic beta-1,2-glucan synthetase
MPLISPSVSEFFPGDDFRDFAPVQKSDAFNPITHGSTPAEIATYKVEPYVVAADVYALPPHTGRGGWTWYTGSAGWMYRLILEALLGLARAGAVLRFKPCLPESWTGFKLRYHYHSTCYHITITKASDGTGGLLLDGAAQAGDSIPLLDDKIDHHVDLILPLLPRAVPDVPFSETDLEPVALHQDAFGQ